MTLDENIFILMADVSRMARRAFDERARTLGVTRTQWQVMTVLKRNEGINQGGLAEHLDVEPITLCRMADRLQEAGMVERRRDPSDRRVWRLYLTDKAKVLSEELKPLGLEVLAEAMEGISGPEREVMVKALGQMRQNLVHKHQAKEVDPGV